MSEDADDRRRFEEERRHEAEAFRRLEQGALRAFLDDVGLVRPKTTVEMNITHVFFRDQDLRTNAWLTLDPVAPHYFDYLAGVIAGLQFSERERVYDTLASYGVYLDRARFNRMFGHAIAPAAITSPSDEEALAAGFDHLGVKESERAAIVRDVATKLRSWRKQE